MLILFDWMKQANEPINYYEILKLTTKSKKEKYSVSEVRRKKEKGNETFIEIKNEKTFPLSYEQPATSFAGLTNNSYYSNYYFKIIYLVHYNYASTIN